MAKKRVALRCEMVDVGTTVRVDVVAKVSLVAEDGSVLYDEYVRPEKPVTDYRTGITGIRAEHLDNGEDFKTVQAEVLRLIKDKILVGHSLENEFAVLKIEHPHEDIIDTSRISPYVQNANAFKTPAMKFLAQKYLNIYLPTPNSTVKNAQALMKLSEKHYQKMMAQTL